MRKKAIPFTFLTTDASPELVQQMYDATIQGFFKKEANYALYKEQLSSIVQY